MGAAYFYHLTEQPLEAALAMLIGKARGAGWPVSVRGRERSELERLDALLWTSAAPEAFPAHGLAGGAHDAAQPVILGTGPAVQDAGCLMSIGGADVSAAEAETAERVCILFDGADPGAVEAARAQWRSLTGAGVSAQYWSDDSGRWQKKAES